MKRVSYSRKEIYEVLRTLNDLVVSLDRIGSGARDQTKEEHDATLAAFIQQHRIFKKAATARRILSGPFPTKLGADGMDELERAMQRVRYWKSPAKPKKMPNKAPEPTPGLVMPRHAKARRGSSLTLGKT